MDAQGSAIHIDGKAVAARVRAEVADAAAALRARGIAPTLAVVLVGDDPASAVYVRSKTRAAREAGVDVRDHKLPATATQAELEALIAGLNADPIVDGILVQLPLPAPLDADAVIRALDPDKDVDGLHPMSLGLLAQGKPRFVPCTPSGCMRLLHEVGAELSGAREVVVAAVGRPELVRGDWIRPGAVVLDVGINRTADGKLVGDVEFAAAAARAHAITPVPGGVGPMTIACLLENTVRAARCRRGGA